MYFPCKIEHIGYLLSPCVFPFPMARILLWSSLLSLVLCSYNRDYVGLVGLVSEWIPIWQGPHTNALSKPGSVAFVIFVMIALNVFVFAFYLYDFQCGTHTHICQASFAKPQNNDATKCLWCHLWAIQYSNAMCVHRIWGQMKEKTKVP